ncbi:hypothetical protein [Xenorhabdus sp. PB30.3]|uniref:hypothetical protein n=1 Tax=Xenorhabdus sp. PB30.3 TaxID=2788941 RepID=UPI001E564FA4|nr:hypothetical protein [Xenorhabdus sp. PB30.3]MCC8381348.1 hypothetical protein [Xenorhabdus sp. PB30.3]
MANIILQKPILPQEHNGIIDKGKLQPPTIDMDVPVFAHISMYDTLTAHFRPAHGGGTIDGGSLVVYRTNMSDYDISTQASLVPVGEYYAYYTVTSVAQPSEPIPSPPVYVKIIDSVSDTPIVVYSSFGVNPDNILEQYQPVCGNETANNVINCYTLSNYKNNKVVDGSAGDMSRAALFVVVNKNRLAPSDSSVTLRMEIDACLGRDGTYGPIYMSPDSDHVTFSIPYYDVTGAFKRGDCRINGGPQFGYGSIQFTFYAKPQPNYLSDPWQGRIITCGSAYQGCSGPGCPDHSYDCPDCSTNCPDYPNG